MNKQFHVMAPARAYGVLIAVAGLILAVGLALPLALASRPSDDMGDRSSTGPIEAPDSIGDGGTETVSTADQLPNTGQGVTDTTIKVGVVLLDLTSVEPLGMGVPNFSTEIQQAAFESLFDAVNAAGGVNGRQIEALYESRDTLATTGPHSDKAICLKLTEDEQVFAVIGFTYAAGTCAALQHQVPVVAQKAALEQVYQDSHGLLVTTDPSLERTARNWATTIVETGLADGHKLGMLSVADGGEVELPANAAADELERLGHPLTVLAELDPEGAVAEAVALIREMKSAGVDSVMLATDFAYALRFIALAEDQRYFPQYLTSDLGALARGGLLVNAGKSLDGAIGFTANTKPAPGDEETPENRACRENYNETTDAPDVPVGEGNAVVVVCAVVDIFLQALAGAGDEPSPRSFVESVEALGTVDGLPVVLPGVFGPGKTDYSDGLQPVLWSSGCSCYEANGEPIDLR